jgi:hypothetical protein
MLSSVLFISAVHVSGALSDREASNIAGLSGSTDCDLSFTSAPLPRPPLSPPDQERLDPGIPRDPVTRECHRQGANATERVFRYFTEQAMISSAEGNYQAASSYLTQRSVFAPSLTVARSCLGAYFTCGGFQ